MKKIFLSLILAAAGLTASAQQQSVTYFRVQFTENLEKVKQYAGDYSTFFNPMYDYIDFKGSLPFTHGSLTGEIDANTYYYIGTGPKLDTGERTKFTLGKTDGTLAIKKVSAYTQPVETITVQSKEGVSAQYADKKTITYTFNALPRNIEELKTLEEHADKAIELDCGKLEYICSLGLRGLLKLQKLSVAKGGTLVLTHVNDEIQKILTLTGFIKLFNFR